MVSAVIQGKRFQKKLRDSLIKLLLYISILFTLIFLAAILYFIISPGLGVITPDFLTEFPRDGMTAGGLFPCIVGTFILVVISVSVSSVLGILCAIYLTEYATQSKITWLIRLSINNLSGVPSIVFGLFGLAFFVKYLGFGVSAISAGLTLSFMLLPLIIKTAEESLRSVPLSLRESSLALGATRWQTIIYIVLPAALPGILTGIILSVGRAAGETAPIIFTGAAYYRPRLPRGFFEPVMALPYHLYVLATSGTDISKTVPIQYATATVLLIIVLLMNLISVIIRVIARRRIYGG